MRQGAQPQQPVLTDSGKDDGDNGAHDELGLDDSHRGNTHATLGRSVRGSKHCQRLREIFFPRRLLIAQTRASLYVSPHSSRPLLTGENESARGSHGTEKGRIGRAQVVLRARYQVRSLHATHSQCPRRCDRPKRHVAPKQQGKKKATKSAHKRCSTHPDRLDQQDRLEQHGHPCSCENLCPRKTRGPTRHVVVSTVGRRGVLCV